MNALPARFLAPAEAHQAEGAVVVVDVLRAFTTAAAAFGAGAQRIVLVGTAEEALDLKRANPGWLAMGEVGGRWADGFDLSNSPVQAAARELTGATIVQRTGAGTQAVIACTSAHRVWCTGLVTASATARAVAASGLGAPDYVLSGVLPAHAMTGDDDLLTAQLVERARLGEPLDARATGAAVAATDEAAHTLALGPEHTPPEDIDFCIDVDRFDFAMEAHREPVGWVLRRTG